MSVYIYVGSVAFAKTRYSRLEYYTYSEDKEKTNKTKKQNKK